jgi:hypothetical protein
MLGFEVRFRDKVINIAEIDGSISVIFGKRDNIFYLDICGMDKKTQGFHRWYYAEDLKLGEDAVIAIKDIDQVTKPMDNEQHESFFPKSPEQQIAEKIDAINQKRLEYFHALENMVQHESRRIKKVSLAEMKGFEIRFKDTVICAATDEDGVQSVIFDYLNNCVQPEGNGTHLYIGGLVSFEHLRWFSGNIDDVDQVVIKVVEAAQSSEPIHSHSQDRSELIQRYYSLKKELQEEGLI